MSGYTTLAFTYLRLVIVHARERVSGNLRELLVQSERVEQVEHCTFANQKRPWAAKGARDAASGGSSYGSFTSAAVAEGDHILNKRRNNTMHGA